MIFATKDVCMLRLSNDLLQFSQVMCKVSSSGIDVNQDMTSNANTASSSPTYCSLICWANTPFVIEHMYVSFRRGGNVCEWIHFMLLS